MVDLVSRVLTWGLVLTIGLTQAKWFRRRLSRNLPQGSVLMPGQQLPPTQGVGS